MTTQNLSAEIKNMPHENVMKAVWANLKGEPLTGYAGIDSFIGFALQQWIMIDVHYDDYNFSEQEYFEIAKFAAEKWPNEVRRIHEDKLSAAYFYDVMWTALKVIEDKPTKTAEDKQIIEIIGSRVVDYFRKHGGGLTMAARTTQHPKTL